MGALQAVGLTPAVCQSLHGFLFLLFFLFLPQVLFLFLVSNLILSAGTTPDVDFFWFVSHQMWMSPWARN